MSQFKVSYGRSCNSTPISWRDPVNTMFIGPDMLAKMEHEMHVIKRNLKASYDRHKIYEYNHRLFKEF